MHRDARPGDALHVRHRGVIKIGNVMAVLLNDAEHTVGRRMRLGAGGNRRLREQAVDVVDLDPLLFDRDGNHQRSDRLGCVLGGRFRRILALDLGTLRFAPGVDRSPHAPQFQNDCALAVSGRQTALPRPQGRCGAPTSRLPGTCGLRMRGQSGDCRRQDAARSSPKSFLPVRTGGNLAPNPFFLPYECLTQVKGS